MSVDEYQGPMSRWVIATPLPFQGLFTDRCASCGARFRGKERRERYEQHWQLEHARSDSPALVEVVVRRDK